MADPVTKPEYFGEVKIGDRFLHDNRWWTRVEENEENWNTNAKSDDGEVSWFGPTLQVEVEVK